MRSILHYPKFVSCIKSKFELNNVEKECKQNTILIIKGWQHATAFDIATTIMHQMKLHAPKYLLEFLLFSK
jgi:hypothetical protein